MTATIIESVPTTTVTLYYSVTASNAIGESQKSASVKAALESKGDSGFPWWGYVLILLIIGAAAVLVLYLMGFFGDEKDEASAPPQAYPNSPNIEPGSSGPSDTSLPRRSRSVTRASSSLPRGERPMPTNEMPEGDEPERALNLDWGTNYMSKEKLLSGGEVAAQAATPLL